MESSSSAQDYKVVSVIDVGSSGIRMEIAEISPSRGIRTLESLHRSVLLGNDTFNTGRISIESLQATCDALKKFKRSMDELAVTGCRAVATNAVREAENRDTFVDRVRMVSGINLEVIESAEQTRLTYTAVQHSLQGVVDFDAGGILLTDVGGGGVEVMFIESGETIYADTYGLGAIRIRQVMRNPRRLKGERTSFLRHVIETAASNISRTIPLQQSQTLIALGGDVRFLAHHVLPETSEDSRYWSLDREQFLKACREIAEVDADRIAREHHLSIGEATTLGPALLIFEQIVEATPANRIIVCNANLRDGLLIDMLMKETGKGEETYSRQIVASAMGLARRYQADEAHATHVARLAVALFDELRLDHGLGNHERLLLEVASLLHEIGSFVHNRSFHKHTLYLIAASEILGLGKTEMDIIANVARYHRRGTPQQSHLAYVALDRAERVIVCKLAAILRVADALDTDRAQKISSPKFRRDDDEFQILVPAQLDTRFEEIDLEDKGNLFQETFGQRPVIVSAFF